MAVKRVWFPNSPSGVVDTSQKRQIAIGYPSLSEDTIIIASLLSLVLSFPNNPNIRIGDVFQYYLINLGMHLGT